VWARRASALHERSLPPTACEQKDSTRHRSFRIVCVDGGRIELKIVELAPKSAAHHSRDPVDLAANPQCAVLTSLFELYSNFSCRRLCRSRCDNGRPPEADARNKPHPPCAFMRPSRAPPYSRDSPSCPVQGRLRRRHGHHFPCGGRVYGRPGKRGSTRASRGGRFLWTLPPLLLTLERRGRARNRNSRSPRRGKRNGHICGRWGFFQAGNRPRSAKSPLRLGGAADSGGAVRAAQESECRPRPPCRHGPRTSPRPRTRSFRPRATARTVMEISRSAQLRSPPRFKRGDNVDRARRSC
jgi:hypothetical protein